VRASASVASPAAKDGPSQPSADGPGPVSADGLGPASADGPRPADDQTIRATATVKAESSGRASVPVIRREDQRGGDDRESVDESSPESADHH
jgi:hypothetical protein